MAEIIPFHNPKYKFYSPPFRSREALERDCWQHKCSDPGMKMKMWICKGVKCPFCGEDEGRTE